MKEIIDGKINDIEYDNASCKILWILKEANISAEDKEKEIDVCEGFRNDWHKKNALSVPTFRKMIYATYGILNPTVEWENVPYANQEAYEVVQQIAYININKLPADSSSNDWEIKKAYDEGKDKLLKQIESLQPNIIIFGNTLKYFETEDLAKIGWGIKNTEKNTPKLKLKTQLPWPSRWAPTPWTSEKPSIRTRRWAKALEWQQRWRTGRAPICHRNDWQKEWTVADRVRANLNGLLCPRNAAQAAHASHVLQRFSASAHPAIYPQKKRLLGRF